MISQPIYLDHNATTPLDPRVAEAMQCCMRQHFANPASQHEPGRQARRALENARERIALLLGANVDGSTADQLIFTSGATEANNLALRGLAGESPGRVLVSAVEHPSVMVTSQYLASRGFDVRVIPVDSHGIVLADELAELLTPDTRVVSVMLGNHETGVLQPVAELADICRAASIPMHTDAVQAAGKIPIAFYELGVAALSVTAHKFHGPRGIGALLLRHDAKLAPLLYGGYQQAGLRPGTEPVVLPVGMAKALELWYEEAQRRGRRMAGLRDRLERQIQEAFPDTVVHGSAVQRLPHTACVSVPGIDRQALVMALDLAGVACSTGSACASGSSEPSPVLQTMGCREDQIASAVRFSLGASTTSHEVDEAARRIVSTINDLRTPFQPRKSSGTPRLQTPKTL